MLVKLSFEPIGNGRKILLLPILSIRTNTIIDSMAQETEDSLQQYKPQRFQLIRTLEDLRAGVLAWRIWSALAWNEFIMTYRRSLIGVFWIIISFLGFVAVKILIFGSMMSESNPTYYYVYMAVGYFIFSFLSAAITMASKVFISAEKWIKNDHLPLSLYAFKAIVRELFTFVLTAVVIVFVFLYFRFPASRQVYLVVPALMLLLINIFWIKILLGTICTRFRDIEYLVATIMRVMLFLSPVLWMPEQMGSLMTYLWWNPFFHLIEIFRGPLINSEIAWVSWLYVSCMTLIGSVVTLIVFSLFRHRIVFWL